MSYAELSSWFPVEEADFVYVHEAFETRLLSGFTAVTRLLVGVIAATTIALAFTGYLSSFISVPTIPTAIELVIALSVINFIGIDISMKRNIAFVVVEVLDLLLVIWSLGSWGAVDPLQMPNGLNGLVHSAFLIFFAYIGFEDLVNVAEETQDASITIPRVILLSIEVTTVLYLLVGRCSRMAGSWTIRFATCTCSTNGTRGKAGLFVVAIALFATTNTVLINLISTSRLFSGVSKEEHRMFPQQLSRIHTGRRTPYLAVGTRWRYSVSLYPSRRRWDCCCTCKSFDATVISAGQCIAHSIPVCGRQRRTRV